MISHNFNSVANSACVGRDTLLQTDFNQSFDSEGSKSYRPTFCAEGGAKSKHHAELNTTPAASQDMRCTPD